MKAPKIGQARVERLIASVKTLGVKAQLQVIDSLKPSLIVNGPHGIRYSVRSVLEYKRATKDKPWDAALIDWIGSFTAGDVFFDIGANTGAFSLLAGAQHRERVRVFAFEPGFESFEALVRNIIMNDLSTVVTPLPVALSDHTALERFNYYKLGAGSASHALGRAVDCRGQPFSPAAIQEVLTFPLDELIQLLRLPMPTRVKLDVDGTEADVIAGATKTLATGTSEVWVEITEVAAEDPAGARLADVLGRLGFTRARVSGHRPEDGFPRVHDALFVRR